MKEREREFKRERERDSHEEKRKRMNGSDDDNVNREGIPKTTFSPPSSSSHPLRFRFRSTSLPKSPSLDKMLFADEDEDEDEDFASDSSSSFAKFVEPPELPTLLIHKVFGKRYAFVLLLLLEFVIYTLSLSLSLSRVNLTTHDILTPGPSFMTTRDNNRSFILGDDVLLLVQSHRVLFRASRGVLYVAGVAGVSDEDDDDDDDDDGEEGERRRKRRNEHEHERGGARDGGERSVVFVVVAAGESIRE